LSFPSRLLIFLLLTLPLTSFFARENIRLLLLLCSIDKFSGVVSLAGALDREEAGDRYTLIIAASDGAHRALTEVQVILKDENDCAPVFDRQVGGVFSVGFIMTRGGHS
jgi:hypothetical protein